MYPTLKSLKIADLFGYKNITLDFNPVTVIVGKNGIGKTTILKILNAMLNREHCDELRACSSAEVLFDDGQKISFKTENDDNENNEIKKNIFEKFISSEIKNNKKVTKKDKERLNGFLNIMLKNSKIASTISLRSSSITVSKELRDLLTSSLKTEFISTINMSANANQLIKKVMVVKGIFWILRYKMKLILCYNHQLESTPVHLLERLINYLLIAKRK